MGPMKSIRWDLSDDRGRSLDGGVVVAESDADALRSILARPRGDLRADRWYRVRAGQAVASAAGDEFARVGGASALPNDEAGDRAKADRLLADLNRQEAERGLRDLLKRRSQDREREAKVRRATIQGGGLYEPGRPIAPAAETVTGKAHRMSMHGVRTDVEQDLADHVYTVVARGMCADCGREYRAHARLPAHSYARTSSILEHLRDMLTAEVARGLGRGTCDTPTPPIYAQGPRSVDDALAVDRMRRIQDAYIQARGWAGRLGVDPNLPPANPVFDPAKAPPSA